MTLGAAFAVSGLNPLHNGYDPSEPSAPHVVAYLYTYGGSTTYYAPYAISAQAATDELVLGHAGADVADEADLTDWNAQVTSRSSAVCYIYRTNVAADAQHLIVFGFEHRAPNTSVQLFVGTEWVRTEPIDPPGTETLALLVDEPGNTSPLVVVARVAGASYATVALTGIEGYIL